MPPRPRDTNLHEADATSLHKQALIAKRRMVRQKHYQRRHSLSDLLLVSGLAVVAFAATYSVVTPDNMMLIMAAAAAPLSLSLCFFRVRD